MWPMTGEREPGAPSSDLPSVGPSYEPERVLRRRREREVALQAEQAIVPVGKRVDQVLGAEHVAEVAAERQAARAQRRAEQEPPDWRHGQRLVDMLDGDEVRQFADEWQQSFDRAQAAALRRRHAARRTPAPRPAQHQSDVLSFEASYTHDIGMSAAERGLGREMLRGLLDGGLDLSELDVSQDEDGRWHVGLATDPTGRGTPTASDHASGPAGPEL